jgi:hypothetical protein
MISELKFKNLFIQYMEILRIREKFFRRKNFFQNKNKQIRSNKFNHFLPHENLNNHLIREVEILIEEKKIFF